MATITMTVLNGLSVIQASASEAWNSDAPVHRNINEWNLSYFPHVVGTLQDNLHVYTHTYMYTYAYIDMCVYVYMCINVYTMYM